MALATSTGAFAQNNDRLFLPVDSEAADEFKRLEELGARGQWDKVVKRLDMLLDEGGKKLLAGKTGFVSVRAEARKRLLALQGRARAAYDLIHADTAKRLYEAGLRRDDTRSFERILAEHPAATVASRARSLLASRYVERGAPGAALPHIDWLLRSGTLEPEERRRLTRLRVMALALAGRRGEATNAVDALKETERVKDAYRRQVQVLTPAPLQAPPAAKALAWRREVFGFYEVSSKGSPPWSLPAGDVATVYAQDGSHCRAVSISTGKLQWRVPLNEEDAFERPLGQCPIALGQGVVLCLLPGDAGLIALDRHDGRRLWTKGLTQLKREASIDFKAHLSATAQPTIVGGVAVLVLVTDHADREVHALAVDLVSGKLAWSVYVASESNGPLPYPVLARGPNRVFVCTGQGALAAIDAHGEILWMRRYKSSRDGRRPGRRRGGFFPGRRRQPNKPVARPLPPRLPTMHLAGGTLWVAPADASAYLAFQSDTGALRGSIAAKDPRILAARGEGVLGFSSGTVETITRSGRRTLAVVGGAVSGMPVAIADRVYVPRADGVVEVRTLEKAMDPAFRWQDGRGHLLAVGGRLVVAAPRSITAYGVDAGVATEELTPEAAAAALGDASYALREHASKVLLAAGPAARTALASVKQARDPEQSLRAQFVLAELDRSARVTRWKPMIKADWVAKVPDLLNRLTHINPTVRLKALEELGTIKKDPQVLVLMEDLMNDGDSRVAFTAAGTLLKLGNRKGMKLLNKMLAAGRTKDRKQAVEWMIKYGAEGDVDALAKALDDESDEIRALAVSGVLKFGKGAAFKRVKPLLNDESARVRMAVLAGLKYAVKDSDEAVAILAKAVRDKDGQIRALAVKSLTESRSPRAFTALGWALSDSNKATAKVAAEALYAAVQVKKQAQLIPVRAIERASMHTDAYYRNYVAQIALRYVDEGGQLSIPTLARFMSDSHQQIRSYQIGGRGWANMLLDVTGRVTIDKRELASLTKITLHPNENIRIQVYQCIAEAAGGRGRGAAVAAGLADKHPTIRQECAEWLLPFDTRKPHLLTPDAIAEVLRIGLNAQRPEGRKAAHALLKRAPLDVLAPGLIPLLLDTRDEALWVAGAELLNARSKNAVPVDKSDRAGTAKAFAVWWWGKRHPELSVDRLLANLTSKNPNTRYRAAQAAASLPLPQVREALLRALDEPLPWVLAEKLKALVTITGKRLGFATGLSPAKLKAVAQRFRAWGLERAQPPKQKTPK